MGNSSSDEESHAFLDDDLAALLNNSDARELDALMGLWDRDTILALLDAEIDGMIAELKSLDAREREAVKREEAQLKAKAAKVDTSAKAKVKRMAQWIMNNKLKASGMTLGAIGGIGGLAVVGKATYDKKKNRPNM